ncbi:hypothetical protein MKW94_019721 [Papaver nudicaule]|uniref:25S rRNA (uridine-N(3))-methyltransferase BMT5-like domain-containing protein n=1 Tax=Papaver nudicaule TaxID=74823 RepID=A0AA41UXZ4_PAPNU|nr:hypothetical protein [Papaver nudicaule]
MEGGSEVKWIKHYSSSHTILLVGEGDFSFSTCLARTFGSAHNMVATSLDSIMLGFYRNAMDNIDELKSRGCTVMHGIDAKTMAQDPTLAQCRFDRIVFNFPYAHGVEKFCARSFQLSEHRNLVRLFFENAKKLLAFNGEIHVTHKTNSFHCEWDVQGLANLTGLRLVEEVDFNLSDYPGYSNKLGVGGVKMDKSFECQPSSTYKFRHA